MNPLKMLSRGGAVSEPSDADFENVTLLLHGDGTNGAQNNTFLDSSTNNFTITRNGNTTQGTFTPFSKVDGRWGFFQSSASADLINFVTSVGSAFEFTGDYTIEAWVFPTALASDTSLFVTTNAGGTVIFALNIDATNYNIYINSGGVTSSFAHGLTLNKWNHVAMVRNGSTITIYTDGVSKGTITNSGTNGHSNPGFARNGGGVAGSSRYMSNLRVVKGTAVYTSAFTPPTTPLTAISGTSLLTCQSNRFKDNSTNNFTITVSGSPRVTPFSPFPTLTAYDAATNGGSGYFDGSGDYLTVADAAALELSNSNFCIECWINTTSSTQYDCIVAREDGSTASGRWAILINNASATAGDVAFWSTDFNGFASAMLFTTGVSIRDGAWHHIALVRNGSSWVIYIDGVSRATQTSSITIGDIGIAYWIGNNGGTVTRDLPGYLSGFRYVVGSAVYTSAFTPPTAPPTAITNTSLLLNFTNAGIIDHSMSNNLETVGNAQIDTTTKKYGTGSMEFDGSGDWLTIANTPDLQLGTGNFTVEFWVYLATGDTGSNRGLVGKGGASTGWLVSLNTTQKVVFTYASSTITSSGAITTNAWNHIAVVREGTGSNQTKIYIGGTNDGTGTVSTDFNQTEIMYVGANRTGGDPMKGFIDDLRITKGKARYTTTFTPPTAALPDIGE